MALRLAPPGLTPTLRLAHERIALLALGGVAAHGPLLLGDGWLRPGLTGILVPFALDYRPVWTGLGLLAGYLAAGLSLTYYARWRLGARRWRAAHRLIPIAWAMAAVHVIGAGTDAGSVWLQVPLALTMAMVLTLLGHRLLGERAPRRTPAPAATVRMATSAPPPDEAPRRRATPRCGPGTRPARPATDPRLDVRTIGRGARRILRRGMTIAPSSTVSALAGMRDAQTRLDVAAHNVANASTEPFAPLRPDGNTDATDTLDLPTQMVAIATAPVVYAANAQVVRAADSMHGSLLDVFA